MAVNRLQLVITTFICCLLCNCKAFNIQWAQEGFSWQRSLPSGSPVCVDIPTNMSLCQGIGYTKMRLPNLLHHDSLLEVSQQAASWIPLFRLGCHPDTQLFLCSLFTPVCLEHPIPPCRSLCLLVQSSCEATMIKYGYPWPTIVRCDQFPVDNDMCIQAQHSKPQNEAKVAQKVAAKPEDLEPQKHHFNPEPQKSEKRRNKHKRKHKHTTGEPESVGVVGGVWNWNSEETTRNTKSDFLVETPVDTRKTENSNANTNGDGKKIYTEVLDKYCSSEWSLKARATLHKTNNGTVFTIRNYKVLHGNFPSDLKSVQISIPPNLSEQLRKNELRVNRRRFYILGREHEAVYAILWPHKLAQFR
ncbi:Secreted frizzled-related protein 5-like protein [Leptotrombidium deliense]|uniref:Secreted frizzled-related protein 5-like protein n=1 Tax=Leptotrombidium deliense TaxID=299467 RepID=A0A443SFY3_9ACAR|nr:Secreted frizzled-related protein 5-like protein [Leptotrombidium deliense]